MKTKQNSKQTKKPTHINANYNIRLENISFDVTIF